MERSYQGPPIVLDTNVLVAGLCRQEASLAYRLVKGIFDGHFPLVLTAAIVFEYLDVLNRPDIRRLTGLRQEHTEDIVFELIELSLQIQLNYRWKPNLLDESDDKFVEAAIHSGAAIVTYNVRDFLAGDLRKHAWAVMTPKEFFETIGRK